MRWFVAALLLAACSGGEAPKTEAPKAEAPKAEAPKAEAPKAEAPPAAPPFGEFKQIAAPGRKVFFVGLADGATVKSPIHIKTGAEGVEVKPAGDFTPNSGHQHLIIDGAPIPPGQAVPKDEKNIHLGKGEVEYDLTLAPGPHTITLQLADFAHRSYGPELATTVKITVE
ncbi:MAG TPA: DUF4399 domain-containing protein [Myxococcota bacterium]|nr:DUF4399 domain-containing protein [Myxococcota bacterium]